MIHKSILFTVLFLVIKSVSAQVINCNLSGIKGKVKSIEIEYFDVLKYDSLGSVTESKPRNSIYERNAYYLFDSSGREVESERIGVDSILGVFKTTYIDSENHYVRRYFYRGNLQHIELVKFNKNKQADTVFNLDSDSSINSIEVKTYNSRGLLIGIRKIDKDMQEISRTISKYTLSGRLKKYTHYKNSKKEYSNIIKYRSSYFVLKRKQKGNNETTKNYYFKNKSVTHNKTRKEKDVYIYELDSFRNTVSSVNHFYQGSTLSKVTHKSYQYEYDSKGNWIKKVDYFEGVPKMVTIRRYLYY